MRLPRPSIRSHKIRITTAVPCCHSLPEKPVLTSLPRGIFPISMGFLEICAGSDGPSFSCSCICKRLPSAPEADTSGSNLPTFIFGHLTPLSIYHRFPIIGLSGSDPNGRCQRFREFGRFGVEYRARTHPCGCVGVTHGGCASIRPVFISMPRRGHN